jgi:glycosyltransferase involved in cell wall biosynthesis
VPPGNAAALLAAIEAALSDPAAAESTARAAARDIVERFDASRMAEAAIGLYATALARRSMAD